MATGNSVRLLIIGFAFHPNPNNKQESKIVKLIMGAAGAGKTRI
jgi:hypothetical protein